MGFLTNSTAWFSSSDLAGGVGIGVREAGVGGAPDAADAVAGADENSGRRERDESQKQGVFDQILALLVINKILYEVLHGGFLSLFF
jgi:hypothetical protein